MGDASDAIRSGRVEIVDDEGRIRLAVGRLERDDDLFGIQLFDKAGRERAWLLLDSSGPRVGLDWLGNTGAELYVLEGPQAAGGGPRLVLCDDTGTPVHAWSVDSDDRPAH